MKNSIGQPFDDGLFHLIVTLHPGTAVSVLVIVGVSGRSAMRKKCF